MEIGTLNEKNREEMTGSADNSSSVFMELLEKRSAAASLSNLRHEYENRLVTFQATTYYAKPPCLSPLFCSRFGWQNADTDMLVCTSCSSALAITLNSKLSANTYDKLCQAYRNKIVSCHAPSCAFRLSSTEELRSFEATEEEVDDGDSEILTVPAYMSQVLPEDSVRLMEHPRPSTILKQSAKKISDTIRSISLNATLGGQTSSFSWVLPKLQIPIFIQQMNSSSELTKKLGCDNESILALSLLGWSPLPNMHLDNSAPFVSFGCPCCLSIMDVRLEQSTADETSPTKRQRLSSRNKNPLEAHRHYCPYKVGFPEKAAHTNPLWKTILERLCEENETVENAEKISTDVDAKVTDDSVNNVRRILRAGIAPRTFDLMA